MIKTFVRIGSVRLLFFVSGVIMSYPQTVFSQKTISCGANKVLICHKGKNTLCISENALKAHLDHGDYMGSCDGTECSVSTSGGIITCKDTLVKLITSSSITVGTYAWSGPDNFTSALQIPNVKKPGTYIVTVTDNASGCVASDTAFVSLNTAMPNISATGGNITCANQNVSIVGSSSTPSVTYSWKGPNGFSSLLRTNVVSDAGIYRLTVTDPANYCISEDFVTVNQNKTPPDVTASVSDTLTCMKSLINISASSSTPRVTFNWNGPEHFYSTERHPFVVLAGKYSVTATNPVNGCTSTNSVTVAIDTVKPSKVSAVISNKLTCTINSATLSGSSGTGNVNFSWSGPNGYGANEQNPIVDEPGLYVLTVVKPVNGCLCNDSVIVQQDTTKPNQSVFASDTLLTCKAPSVTLTSSTTTPGTTLTWVNHPTGVNPVTVYLPGNYYAIVKKDANGCTKVDSIVVTQNIRKPDLIAHGGTITPANQIITISASSGTPVTYLWSGNVTLSDPTLPGVQVFEAGVYAVTVTSLENGCTNSTTVTVNLENATLSIK